jgi:hypothetical protein
MNKKYLIIAGVILLAWFVFNKVKASKNSRNIQSEKPSNGEWEIWEESPEEYLMQYIETYNHRKENDIRISRQKNADESKRLLENVPGLLNEGDKLMSDMYGVYGIKNESGHLFNLLGEQISGRGFTEEGIDAPPVEIRQRQTR